jgi:ribose transport system permease protein
MDWVKVQRTISKHSYLFSLVLLIAVLAANRNYQDNMFELDVLNRNLRTLLPAIFLAVGQTIVIIVGGIDLSVYAILTLVNAVLATQLKDTSSLQDVQTWSLLCCGIGLLAGSFNGFCVAYLRLQPIVTTYATGFLFGGIALYTLPRPGADLPREPMNWFRQPYTRIPQPFSEEGLPLAVYMIALIVVLWLLLRSTRYGQYLYASGGKADAAYASGVPVNFVRFSSYLWSGLLAAIAGIFFTLTNGAGSTYNPVQDQMTLASIVAVVLGGTRLSGGQGGVIGSIIGVIILTYIGNVISFAHVDDLWRTLVDALIIVIALAIPGLFQLVKKVRAEWTQ